MSEGTNRPTGGDPAAGRPDRAESRQSRRALALGFAIVALAILALLIAIYWQLAHPILWAATLAVLIYPVHERIVRLVGGRARLGASISTLLAIAVLFIPATFALLHLINEARNLWPSVRDTLGPEGLERIARWVEESRFRGMVHFLLGGSQGTGAEALQTRLQDLTLSLQEFILTRLRSVTRGAPYMLVQMGVTLLAFFFFLKEGPGWAERLENALPMEPAHAKKLVRITGQTINAVFRGVILTALVQALLAGLGYWVAGAPTPVLLLVITFLAALIPFVGPVAVWLPTAVGLYLSGRTGAAVGLAIWGTLVVSLIDNTFRPWAIGRETKLPLLWLFLAILGGLRLFGFLGVVLGPAALALGLACYRIYREGRAL